MICRALETNLRGQAVANIPEMTLTSGKEWTKMYKKGVRLVIRQFENEMKTAAVNFRETKSRKKTNLHKDRCLKTQ